MITKISPNAPTSSAAETQLDAAASIKAKLAAKTTVDPKIAHVAQQFEEVFVRQLLTTAKMGGETDKSGGFGAMTIDALATGVSKGGGLGIAKSIEMALTHYNGPTVAASSAHETSEKAE